MGSSESNSAVLPQPFAVAQAPHPCRIVVHLRRFNLSMLLTSVLQSFLGTLLQDEEDQGEDQGRGSTGGGSSTTTPRSSFTSTMLRAGSIFQKKGGGGDAGASASTNGAAGSGGSRSRSSSRDGAGATRKGSKSFMPTLFSKATTKVREHRGLVPRASGCRLLVVGCRLSVVMECKHQSMSKGAGGGS